MILEMDTPNIACKDAPNRILGILNATVSGASGKPAKLDPVPVD